MKKNKNKFAINLKKYREQKGLSQGQLAQSVFVSRTLINKYESGKAVPSEENINRIAEVLNISPNDLQQEVNEEIVIKVSKKKLIIGITSLLILVTAVSVVTPIIININKFDMSQYKVNDCPKVLINASDECLGCYYITNYSDGTPINEHGEDLVSGPFFTTSKTDSELKLLDFNNEPYELTIEYADSHYVVGCELFYLADYETPITKKEAKQPPFYWHWVPPYEKYGKGYSRDIVDGKITIGDFNVVDNSITMIALDIVFSSPTFGYGDFLFFIDVSEVM